MEYRNKVLLALIVGLQTILLASTQFTAWPEMTLWPYLMIHGWLPYKDIAIAHAPLLLYLLSGWYGLLGIGLGQLKIFTWILIVVTNLAIYFIAGKGKKGLIASSVYAILTFIYGSNGLWFETLMAPLALFTYYSLTQKKYLIAGLMFGLMLLTKQTAVWFVPAIALTTIPKFSKKILTKLSIGVSVILLACLALFAVFGILTYFFRWAVQFGIFTLPFSIGQVQYPSTRQLILAFIPMSAIAFPFIFRTNNKVLILWILGGVLGAYSRWELFHFQPALPFIALLITYILTKTKINKLIIYGYLFGILAMAFINVLKTTNLHSRFYDKGTLLVSTYIASKTRTNEKVYIINDWDNLYVLSRTLPSAKPWVPYLPWYLNQPNVEENIVSDLRSVRPRLIIQKEFSDGGLATYRSTPIMQFVYQNYTLSGTIEGRNIWEKR